MTMALPRLPCLMALFIYSDFYIPRCLTHVDFVTCITFGRIDVSFWVNGRFIGPFDYIFDSFRIVGGDAEA